VEATLHFLAKLPSASLNSLAPSRPLPDTSLDGLAEPLWTSSSSVRMPWPADVAVASDGRVYVRDVEQARITTLDAEGTIIGGWGSPGSGEGQFEFKDDTDPHAASFGGMAILDDEIFVADKRRVQRFDLDGKLLGAWGSRGRKPGQILKAQHMAAGPDGNIFIVDTVLKRVQAFAPGGKLVAGWPIPVKDVRYPSVICVTSTGEVIVADERGEVLAGEPGVVIYKFSSGGKLLTSWGEPDDGQGDLDAGEFAGTTGCACSTDGRVYISEDSSNRIQTFDFDGKFLFSFGGAPGAEPNGAVALSGDSLVVTDGDAGNVSKFRLTQEKGAKRFGERST